ncbi:hypothetical protein Poli38472_007142 [Pythium oligandrum]|uniref:Kazal-like domain-containing protein n=1 Tax=Pythium oligandrum TaxID=41045 RepID=A0A8K1FGS1_PYTOL|nr:hypothetical protein Poli38472_007142 [Pythium oligandrum]|eukprot:TMW58997.1 hypothetical protein Poli38472_007142 [Pythium oligandrum]
MTDSPVCASNGISYANHCFFHQAQCVEPALSFVSTGLCDDAQAFNLAYNPPDTRPSIEDAAHCDAIVCADVLDPVCTSQGTMRNLCYWKKAQCRDNSVTLVRRIACEDSDSLMPKCPAECTQEYVPVCASNGVLYGNECLFRQARCLRETQFGITLTARDLSYCQQQLGDSEGGGIDIAALMAASVS